MLGCMVEGWGFLNGCVSIILSSFPGNNCTRSKFSTRNFWISAVIYYVKPTFPAQCELSENME